MREAENCLVFHRAPVMLFPLVVAVGSDPAVLSSVLAAPVLLWVH